jgi:hypothetical protein
MKGKIIVTMFLMLFVVSSLALATHAEEYEEQAWNIAQSVSVYYPEIGTYDYNMLRHITDNAAAERLERTEMKKQVRKDIMMYYYYDPATLFW